MNRERLLGDLKYLQIHPNSNAAISIISEDAMNYILELEKKLDIHQKPERPKKKMISMYMIEDNNDTQEAKKIGWNSACKSWEEYLKGE